MKKPLLTINNLTKSFDGHVALKDISLVVSKGVLFGLVGPNGAGKTTLIRAITGIYAADAGEISWHPEQPAIGYLPEERGLYKKMKVQEQLVYLGRLRGMSKKEAVAQTNEWCRRLGLTAWAGHPLGDLSKGMQQKVQFIAAVIHHPALLILDEPFSGFDPLNAEVFKQEILRLKNEGTTIIFSTHRMESVDELCEDVALVNRAAIVEQGALSELKKKHDPGQYVITAPQRIKLPENVKLISHRSEEDVHHYTLQCDEKVSKTLLRHLLDHDIAFDAFYKKRVTMQELFLKLVEKDA